MAQEKTNQPHTTTSSRELQRSSTTSTPDGDENNRRIVAVLTRLALHYWRPDFGPSQVKLLMGDFLQDLEAHSSKDVEYACAVYRQDPENRFYPTPGQLLGILNRYELKGPSLPKYQPPQIEMKQATKSVAQVLKEAGFPVGPWEG